MSKYYGSTEAINYHTTVASRRGYKGIRSSAQTWDGSLIAVARDSGKEVVFEIEISDESSLYGKTFFSGTLEELKSLLNR